jgi:hypothetical protein
MGGSGIAAASPDEFRLKARTAGVAYLITIAAGIFAEVYVRASIRSGDPIGTGERLRSLEELYRFGVLADGLMLVSYVVVTALLYRLFEPVSATASFLAALFSVIGIALLAASMTILLLPIYVEGGSTAFDALRLHGAAYNLTGLFFGPYCALIGWLVIRSRWLPAWIGWLMLLAGATFVFDASVELAAPEIANRVPEAVMLISLIAEGALAVRLAAFGLRETQPRLN